MSATYAITCKTRKSTQVLATYDTFREADAAIEEMVEGYCKGGTMLWEAVAVKRQGHHRVVVVDGQERARFAIDTREEPNHG